MRNFITKVAEYFMAFLETDFHKRRLPKRSIKIRNSENLQVGLNTEKYEKFYKKAWGLVQNGFDEKKLPIIEKGVYQKQLPDNLLDLINRKVKKVSSDNYDIFVKEIGEKIKDTSDVYANNPTKAYKVSMEEISKNVKDRFVLPLVNSIEHSIDSSDLGDKGVIFIMEEELTDILSNNFNDVVPEIVNSYLSEENIEIEKYLRKVVESKDIKDKLSKFFENIAISDLYNEISELKRNKDILDKHELYFYFGDINFRNNKYPIFYIPVYINKRNKKMYLDFDAKIYINKKALEYIVQEYNHEKNKRGSLQGINERIIYLSRGEKLQERLQNIFDEITDLFQLDLHINLSKKEKQRARSYLVWISNSCYISLFDKADEALINDYELLLREIAEGGELAESFKDLIEGFIMKEPESFRSNIEQEWREKTTAEKLTFQSPIPLNSEQRQILSAINKKGCNYISVEGPPGTGKSHTITAIVFDAILKNKSTLILSDKKEALDVVETKITNTLGKVRHQEKFQNPILRLDKKNLPKILAKPAIAKIKAAYLAVNQDYKDLKQNLNAEMNFLKEEIEAEVLAGKKISMDEVNRLLNLHEYFENNRLLLNLEEVKKERDVSNIKKIRTILSGIKNLTEKDNMKPSKRKLLSHFEFSSTGFRSIDELKSFLEELNSIYTTFGKVYKIFEDKMDYIADFPDLNSDNLGKLKELYSQYVELRVPLIGYLFKGGKLEKLSKEFKKEFPYSAIETPHKELDKIADVIEVSKYLVSQDKIQNKEWKVKDVLSFLSWVLSKVENAELFNEFIDELRWKIIALKKLSSEYNQTFRINGIKLGDLRSAYQSPLFQISEKELDRNLEYYLLKQKISSDFQKIPSVNYQREMKKIQGLSTLKMSHILDKRLMDFAENNPSSAKTLKDIIKNKKEFPKDEFRKLKSTFPCILAGIRDYAEYIPLEPQAFDIVIIDEASQVSIAQAFPALLRAKTTIVLGDPLQFGNVKATNAGSDTNREYMNILERTFRQEISEHVSKMEKIKYFDIKKSILDFFEFIHNYSALLKKHFRGYKENISFSNEFFYEGNLQVMKVRGKPVDEVLQFCEVAHDGKEEIEQNTNLPEIEFIISELKGMKERGEKESVGVITPFRNQQAKLHREISKLPESDYFFDELQLKIMTFDTSQGEERDIIYYSMVGTTESDKLWAIFPKELKDGKNAENDLRLQRLNVGFSRSKETMKFVLSKPVEEYSSAARRALLHYKNVIEEAKKEKGIEEVDEKSIMEPEVLNWFYQTKFWKENKDNIDFIPQFKIGTYLKQLDIGYNHPEYKVDFLLIYTDGENNRFQIIIEYDGFLEHFKSKKNVNRFNYGEYYSENDVYRQKVLEGYGYQFLRINKFNSGSNPIETLDERIQYLVNKPKIDNQYLRNIKQRVKGLENGQKKWCPWCDKIRDIEDFKDSSLINGYGRKCVYCKGLKNENGTKSKSRQEISQAFTCPECGARMVIREGPYGKFYGCSKFPYCRGTRKNKV